jgi:oxygen-independent coproporphyrinogen-3 oxidase
MGVQSFRDEELRRLGRIHDAARARAALDATRAAGIDNVSLDLMLWLPQQTIDECLFSVRALAALQPAHASLYLLELYPNAPLKEAMARSGWSLAPDDDAADMYLRALETLGAAGYEQYEISNFSRPGLACRHNLKYWSDGEWLAFGCGAHSTMDGVRWKNVSATEMYVRGLEDGGAPVIAERRELTPAERFQEAVFMRLRLVAGLDLHEVEQRYGIDVWERYGDRLARFVEAGLLVREPADGAAPAGTLRLSPRGLLLSNEVMISFIDAKGTVE